ncbi:Uncharacterised protein [BD1-7 clade bacterium]|uniref:Beta propeller domain-containing protein n=1 Tax=BD1-7 clade bacterium TaxID=2029982 RepID=A0A5S9N5F4_9GAMM|nr:Uncharacterised protein [BD1-7 clade bacterium]CAA0085061.1 Uncharacterised protein [BD1-7 clade bacterium]
MNKLSWSALLCLCSVLVGCAEPDDGISGTGWQHGSELEGYLKDGMMNRSDFRGDDDGEVSLPNGGGDAGRPSGDRRDILYSDTNNQVAGVQEMDVVKTEGRFIFHLTRPEYLPKAVDLPSNERDITYTLKQHLQVFAADHPEQQLPLQDISLGGEGQMATPIGLMLHKESSVLVALGRQSIDFRDVATPATGIPVVHQIIMDARIRDVRLIDNQLIVISSYQPPVAQIEGFESYATSQQAYQKNQQILAGIPLQTLLPTFTLNGQPQPMIDPLNCEITLVDKDANNAGLSLVTVIDVENPAAFSTYCQADNFSSVFVSAKNVYLIRENSQRIGVLECLDCASLASSEAPNPKTTVVRIGMDDVPSFKGRFYLKGYVHDDAYRFSEYEDHLRVVHSVADDHQLDIFALGTNGVSRVSQLPNAQNPVRIGKPNERIQGIRFAGDRAYVVTFERSDPLYVLDLKDPASPFVAGELEIPGFSSYLYPVDEDWLIGFGSTDQFSSGFKISLYDIRDYTAPKEIQTQVFNNGWSPIRFNPLVLTAIRDQEDSIRFALPVSIYDGTPQEFLYLFSLAGIQTEGDASLVEERRLETANDSFISSARGIFINDYVHMLYGKKRYFYHWPL